MKIEIDKPVIPQFVADWIEFCKDGGATVYGAITDNLSNSMMDWLFNEEKVDDFAKAWVIGYEVEQPLYYAKIKGWEILGKRSHWIYLKNLKEFTIGTSSASHMEIDVMTKEEWNALGINDANADFEEVEVWEVDLSEVHKKDGESGKAED